MLHDAMPDRHYYARRANAELAAAQAAVAPEVSSIHLRMADYYVSIVTEMDRLTAELTACLNRVAD